MNEQERELNVVTDARFTAACHPAVAYGFFGRRGGVSGGLYAALNCGVGSRDDPSHVAINRRAVARHLTGREGEVATLWQCHSADALILDAALTEGERPRADAIVTDKAGLVIGCLTADCGPVLFTARKANDAPVIAATHAGWGGALKGVLETTVAKMLRLGAQRETISACVGPCIQQASYEVSGDFMGPFVQRDAEAEHFFKAGRRADHLMFDLPGYIAFRLAQSGVRNVSLMGLDTYTNEADYYSYRRATHREEPDYGRQIAGIVINS